MQISPGEGVLVLLIITGLIGRSPILATAASMLLVLKLASLERFFPTVERRGMEVGLLFLTISVLVPFASEKITAKDLIPLFTTLVGVAALTGGALATYLNGKGLDMLRAEPHLIVGLIVGSIIGIVFLRGIPVGPLMAAAITTILLKFISFISKFL
ncbi:DUF441 domain-containing protein [Aneurinibacillus danicus]|jgi:uncharacterized membrane protein (DUF441 family)|uniref:UPF0756 membrane protein ADA01nite_31540 n=2 Tax=Aneurinibacillus TaxID=55079 RepID=A0A511V9U8_9BACL|nr:UPF0756 membrane protein [Aneurinibacillus danicus]